MDPAVAALLDDLQRTRFRDLAGARVSAHLPLSAALLNRMVADVLARTTAPVRQVDVRPRSGDRFDVVVSLKWALVPSLTVTVAIARQPAFPDAPVLELQWSLPAGLGMIASQFVGGIAPLPEGVRLVADRVLLDLERLASRG